MKYSFSYLATCKIISTIFLIVFFLYSHVVAADTTFLFTKNLSIGSVSSDVKELQKFLNTNGYTVSIKGPGSMGNETDKFGSGTWKALIRFQKDKKITPPSGFLGPITRGHINKKSSRQSVVPVVYTTIPTVLKPIYLGGNHYPIQITNQTITGISIPTPGGTPAQTTENSQYSTTITWNGNPVVYAPGTSYVATITVTAKPGYTLAGIPANFFIVAGAITTNVANSGIVTAVFPQTSTIPLTISAPVITLSKPYDGTTSADVIPGSLTGVIGGDDVTVSAVASYDTATVGTGKIITVTYTLGGAHGGNYIKPSDYTVNTGEITLAGPVATPSATPSASRIPVSFALSGSITPVGTSVSLSSATSGSTIYYTTDGSTPTTASAVYSTPLLINSTTTVKAIASKYGSTDSAVMSGTYTLNKSGTGAMPAFPHGSAQVGDKFYELTRATPATLTVFNDPNDLTNYQKITLTGHNNGDVLIYDSVHDKLYAETYDGAGKTTILQIDPNNITNWSVVYNEGVTLPTTWVGPLVTDGTYVYGATYRSAGSKLFKIRISDWTVVATNPWTGVGAGPHAAQLVMYSDRKEMYITTVYTSPTKFAKVNLSDMSYVQATLGTADAVSMVTDDMACNYVDNNGSICYAGSDVAATRNVGFKINTQTMAVTEFSIGTGASYGMFIYNNNLYSTGTDGTIVRYQNLDTTSPEVFLAPGIVPNEFFYSSSGKLFTTDGQSPNSELLEFKLGN